jgi:four helix bundle protein
MKANVVKDKSFAFSLRVIKLYKFLTEQKKEYVLSKQLLRSGCSIGALIREAEHAESKADFTHKLSIALKEANEADYWLELLFKSDYIDAAGYNSVNEDVKELLKLLTSIVKSSKNS